MAGYIGLLSFVMTGSGVRVPLAAPVISPLESARLLALTLLLALRHRLQTPRCTTLSGAETGAPLLACAYASIGVAIDRPRGSRREGSAEAQNKQDGEKEEHQ